MNKIEIGIKRTCTGCRIKFYDLKQSPIVCPKCHQTFIPVAEAKGRARGSRSGTIVENISKLPSKKEKDLQYPVIKDVDADVGVEDDFEIEDHVLENEEDETLISDDVLEESSDEALLTDDEGNGVTDLFGNSGIKGSNEDI
ncbi:MAG: TIGR02300 family protein [Alphaproteobacteria bacterium]|nr:TIGR02300 family protein [Alphaproteobacteria bacterium]